MRPFEIQAVIHGKFLLLTENGSFWGADAVDMYHARDEYPPLTK